MDNALLYPLFTLVLLTFSIGFLSFKTRVKAVKNKQISPSYFQHNRGKAPEQMLRYNDNYQNLFELPILFYVLIGLLLITQNSSIGLIIGSWLFVFTRIIHSYIHIKTNHIPHRLKAFLSGSIILFIMWISFIIKTI